MHRASATSCSTRYALLSSDISVSKINLVSITVLCVTGFFLRFYLISGLKYFSVSVSIVSFFPFQSLLY